MNNGKEWKRTDQAKKTGKKKSRKRTKERKRREMSQTEKIRW